MKDAKKRTNLCVLEPGVKSALCSYWEQDEVPGMRVACRLHSPFTVLTSLRDGIIPPLKPWNIAWTTCDGMVGFAFLLSFLFPRGNNTNKGYMFLQLLYVTYVLSGCILFQMGENSDRYHSLTPHHTQPLPPPPPKTNSFSCLFSRLIKMVRYFC